MVGLHTAPTKTSGQSGWRRHQVPASCAVTCIKISHRAVCRGAGSTDIRAQGFDPRVVSGLWQPPLTACSAARFKLEGACVALLQLRAAFVCVGLHHGG
jgi:hypothetical protein